MLSFKEFCNLNGLTEEIKGWKHAGRDLNNMRADRSKAALPVKLHKLTAKGTESGMHDAETHHASEDDGQRHVDNMHKMNPGKKFSYNKYVDGKHVGVMTKSTGLTESVFVSDSPYASSGIEFEVKKNKEKSVGEHVNGQPKEHHDVYHKGKHIGHVNSYSGYQDKKQAGSRVVSSRKDVRKWAATVYGGEHNQHGSNFHSTPAEVNHSTDGFSSKKDALQSLANSHKSNPKMR